MKRSALLFVALIFAATGLTRNARADVITGPTVTTFDVGGSYVNPRVGTSVPVSYSFTSTAWTTVTVTVNDGEGNVVRTLDSKQGGSGASSTSWDGRDADGAAVSDGDYNIVATPAGFTYASTIGSAGSGEGQLNLPRTVAVAQDATLWVADGDYKLEHFDPDGTYLGFIDTTGTPYSYPYTIRIDHDGSLLISNATRHAYKIDPADGSVLAQIPPAGAGGADTTPPYSGEIWDLQQLTNGNYLTSGYTGCCPNQPCCGYWSLWEYASDFTTFIRSWGGQPRLQSLTQLPDSTIVGASGYDGNWYHFAPAGYQWYGQSSVCMPGCRYGGHFYGMDHGTGNSFILSSYEYHQIIEYPEANPTPTWALGTTAGGSAHGQLELPRGISISGDDLYIADYFNNRVEHYVRSVAVSTQVTVDTRGPSTSDVSVTPSLGGGAVLSARGDDSASGGIPLGSAEYFLDTTGNDGSGSPLTAQDGVFDSASEAMWAYIRPADGQHTIFVHSKDGAGNWGGYQTLKVLATPAGVLPLPL